MTSNPSSAVQSYVTSCIEKETLPFVYELARQGGQLDFKVPPFRAGIQEFGFGFSVVATPNRVLPTREEMENQLAQHMIPNFSSCINNFEVFKKARIEIEEISKPESNVTIADKKIIVDIKYDLRIKTRNGYIALNNFKASISSNLGELHSMSEKIVRQCEEDPKMLDEYLYSISRDNVDVFSSRSCPVTLVILLTDPSQKTNKIDPLVFAFANVFYENNRPNYLTRQCV